MASTVVELLRRRFGGKKEDEWQLVNDVTLGGDVITPIAYDSNTQEYEVASYPSWASAAIGTAFSVVVVPYNFSDVSKIPIPSASNSNSISIKKTDSTHFTITQGTATSDIANWSLARNLDASKLEVISAADYSNMRGIPLRMVVTNTSGYISLYNCYKMNGLSGYSQGPVIRTNDCSNLGYQTNVKLLGSLDIEFTLSTTEDKVTFTLINEQTCIIIKNGSFNTLTSSNLGGDYSGSLWGKNANSGVYIGGIGIARPDCNVKLYKKNI